MGDMNDIFNLGREALNGIEQRLGMSRRDYLQFCATLAVTMGLPKGADAAVAKAIESAKRPSVIWLHFQECTGCTESLLRAEHPTLEKLILDVISLDYHETLMAAAGHQAEAARKDAMKANKGKYVLVIEGAIPIKENGNYCKIGGHTAIDLLKECAADAAAVIAIGSCASWGGMPSTGPNPSGASSVAEVLGKPVVTIPGCPPNPYNFLATVVHFLTFGKLPEVDKLGRPKFAYSRLIHENCERRAHFDAGRFAMEFGDAGHRQGYCLELEVAGADMAPPPLPDPGASASVARARARLGLYSEECCAAALHTLHQPAIANLNLEHVHEAVADIEIARIQLGHAAPRSAAAAAVSSARRSLSLNPTNGRALSVIGWAEVVVNDRPEGLTTLEDALKAAPDDADVRSRYGWALRHAGEFAAATAALRDASDLAPDADVATLALFAFNRLIDGEVSLARELAETSIASDPYEYRTLLICAIIASRLDDHAAAIDYGRRLLDMRSRNVAHCEAFLAYLLHRGGHENSAAELLAKAVNDRTHFRHSTFAVPAMFEIYGEREALTMLDQARAAGCPHRGWLLHAVDLNWLAEIT